VSYAIARNQFRIGYLFYNKGGIFNVVRRSRNQFLYVVPPFVAAYMMMEWANDK
jgi:ubiquinol-cytochrome c reductase subunit 8